jgi:hypothetical protein
VKFLVEVSDELKELVAAPCQNGKFTITLPETIDSRWLVEPYAKESQSTLKVSDRGVRTTAMSGFSSDSGDIAPFSEDGTVTGTLFYVDRNVTITGYEQYKNKAEYNLDLKAGWNWVYITEKNETTFSTSTAKPNAELKWYLDAEEEE